MPFSPTHLTEEPTRTDVEQRPGTTLLEFGAPWCGHCQRAQPLIEALLDACTDVTHLKIEDGPGRPLGRSYRVKLWPTLVVLQDGQEVARVVRPDSAEALAAVHAALGKR